MENLHSKSPSKVPATGAVGAKMDFFAALKKVLEGKKIHKLEWENKEYYGFLMNGLLTLHKPTGTNHQWIVNDGDMSGIDYIVLEG